MNNYKPKTEFRRYLVGGVPYLQVTRGPMFIAAVPCTDNKVGDYIIAFSTPEERQPLLTQAARNLTLPKLLRDVERLRKLKPLSSIARQLLTTLETELDTRYRVN